jgi:hypothetical protein
LQQEAIVVAVGRIQERGQQYADVYASIIKCLQDIAVIFATGAMEMGVNDHEIESPFQANTSIFPVGFTTGHYTVKAPNASPERACTAGIATPQWAPQEAAMAPDERYSAYIC